MNGKNHTTLERNEGFQLRPHGYFREGGQSLKGSRWLRVRQELTLILVLCIALEIVVLAGEIAC